MQTTNDSAFRAPLDAGLAAFEGELRQRDDRFRDALAHIERGGGLLGPFSQGHHYFGFNRGEQDGTPGVWYREWAPAARSLHLTGDFNGWNRTAHPLQQGDAGVWSLFLPDHADTPLVHGSRVKVSVVDAGGESRDRIPAYIRRVIQEADHGPFVAQVWLPPVPYQFTHPAPALPPGEGIRIYEAHVGMAQEAGGVGSFDDFTQNVLPRIAALGYNALQLMAVMEHPYYASFGYHVSSFFAVSSRFGTPEDLMRLIDAAHAQGILVLLDLVHSHAVANVLEGLNRFDGTDWQYFHAGDRGHHAAWGSLVFDYAKPNVRQFLLSNVRYWLDEFHFDGFRFDGVTSMLFRDHGIRREFTAYSDYFGGNIDEDALIYLKLANALVQAVRPGGITIAEEVSGFPGLARPLAEGGAGFTYRLAMGLPDFWERLAERDDLAWNLGEMWHTLLDRRHDEKTIGYVESHDQSIVGGKTFAFRLMGDTMYDSMGKANQNPVVDRGVALHKLARLMTFGVGGEGYLNFIGNEFGHPEWVDFPREANGFSHHYARRQWSLADSADLRYAGLNAFDREMLRLDTRFHLLTDGLIELLSVHEENKTLIFRRGALVFAFNFHPTNSYFGERIPVPDSADYRLVLDTDAPAFSGFGRVASETVYPMQNIAMNGRAQSLQIYLPTRTAQVLAPATS